jgi:uncharacterized peroxidase-related enzyme
LSRLTIPSFDDAPEESKPILEAIKQQLGSVPNLFRLIAKSPAALTAYSSGSGALAKTLDLKTRERIALAVSQVNGCEYCLSAHSYIATNMAKISPEEIALARKGVSTDAKANAAVQFARKMVEKRGQVEEVDVDHVIRAGFTEAQVVEIVALVAETTFTNYLNEVAKTDIDFPVVRAFEPA